MRGRREKMARQPRSRFVGEKSGERHARDENLGDSASNQATGRSARRPQTYLLRCGHDTTAAALGEKGEEDQADAMCAGTANRGPPPRGGATSPGRMGMHPLPTARPEQSGGQEAQGLGMQFSPWRYPSVSQHAHNGRHPLVHGMCSIHNEVAAGPQTGLSRTPCVRSSTERPPTPVPGTSSHHGWVSHGREPADGSGRTSSTTASSK